MRIAFLCKRRYMSKDVIIDRYARLYEIPRQLARLGHNVCGFCFSYQVAEDGIWQHDASPGSLIWRSRSLGMSSIGYPAQMFRELSNFKPDVVIGASDIPHIILGHWLAKRLKVPFVADLYDNFEGFGQARIPGLVTAFRYAVRGATLVTTTSAPLRDLVVEKYAAQGSVVSMPSTVDLTVFKPGNKRLAREMLGLPADAVLIGTAGGLYREKGIEPIYSAWHQICQARSDVHLVLAGPTEKSLPPPTGDRVHLLGNLPHGQVATLFQALDVGLISVLDTSFGRYCFPQKAYEMLACRLPVISSSVGEMRDLLAGVPQVLFSPNNATSLLSALNKQLHHAAIPNVPILNWEELVSQLEVLLVDQVMAN